MPLQSRLFSLCSIFALGVFSVTANAQATLSGSQASNVEITYQVGPNNNVVGQMTNKSAQQLAVTVVFKGYSADGAVSQGNPMSVIPSLGPGETARFNAGGFFEHVKSVKLISLQTTP